VGFIQSRDSFYMASITENGWPYIQHRGGAVGFLHVMDNRTLAFADYRGNRQLLSTGNLAVNDRVALFLMDYPQRTRLKILGHARVEDARQNGDLAWRLTEPSESRMVERLFFIKVVAFDWNCPAHITPRFIAAEIEQFIAPLHRRIEELEAQIKGQT
jgi:predicted pyridoxine 5'-phosphate oxidase superfamily flavin-nucleotide-binding protein